MGRRPIVARPAALGAPRATRWDQARPPSPPRPPGSRAPSRPSPPISRPRARFRAPSRDPPRTILSARPGTSVAIRRRPSNHDATRLLTKLLVAASLSCAAGACGGSPDGGENVGSSEADLSSSEKTAYNFFVSKGLKGYQAAGIVGNLMQESSVSASSVQYGGGPGRGIAQWSVGGRWDTDHDDNVVWYAGKEGLSRWSLMLQLDFIWYELETFHGYGLASLRAASNVTAATEAFERDFEGCGTCDQSRRIQYAEQALSAYGGGSGTGSGGGKGCYSNTLGKTMPNNACVQSRADDLWYQCDDGDWVDRWTDPTACNGVHPL